MKYAAARPLACKLVKITSGTRPVQEGRIFIELINGPILSMAERVNNSAPQSRDRLRAITRHCPAQTIEEHTPRRVGPLRVTSGGRAERGLAPGFPQQRK